MKKLDSLIQKLVELEDLKAETHKQIMAQREVLITEMQSRGFDHAETIYGKVGIGHRTKYDISNEDQAALKKLKAAYDIAKKQAESRSPFTEEPFITLSRPKTKDMVPPTTYVSKKVKVMKKEAKK